MGARWLRRFGWVIVLVAFAGCGAQTEQVASSGGGTGTTLAPGTTRGSGGAGPRNAKRITFEVEYAKADLTGEAEVAYTVADGTTVKKSVALPWKSEEITVTPGRSYRVSASAPVVTGSAFNCGVHTDNRWNAGTSGSDGTCVYTFPDDAGD